MSFSLINLNKDRRTGDYLFDIARGCYDDATLNHKFGVNPDIDAGTGPETIWSAGGLYPWSALDTPQVVYVVTTNAADIGVVTVEGLDADWNVVSEDVSVNGIGSVVTTTVFKRVFRLLFTNTASNNVGVITARTVSSSGTIVAQIDAGVSQSLMAVYSVPSDHTAYLRALEVTVDSNKAARFRVLSSENGGAWRVKHTAEMEGIYIRSLEALLKFEEKTDIDFVVLGATANNTSVSANFDIVLIKN